MYAKHSVFFPWIGKNEFDLCYYEMIILFKNNKMRM